jgi:hypothetical protein
VDGDRLQGPRLKVKWADKHIGKLETAIQRKSEQLALPIAAGGRLFPRIARHTEQFRSLYRRRALIEKEFAHLKREHALTMLRVRGLKGGQLHVDLTLLARLAVTLNRTQETTLAA